MTSISAAERSLLTTSEIAAELRCSTRHIRRLVNEQGMPSVLISPRRRLFRLDDVIKWASDPEAYSPSP